MKPVTLLEIVGFVVLIFILLPVTTLLLINLFITEDRFNVMTIGFYLFFGVGLLGFSILALAMARERLTVLLHNRKK